MVGGLNCFECLTLVRNFRTVDFRANTTYEVVYSNFNSRLSF